MFSREAVEKLFRQLATGEVSRLRSRANKRHADINYSPPTRQKKAGVLDGWLAWSRRQHLGLTHAIWALSIALVLKDQLLPSKTKTNAARFAGNTELEKIVRSFQAENRIQIPSDAMDHLITEVSKLSIRSHTVLGEAFQLFQSGGHKSEKGIFFTPEITTNQIVKSLFRPVHTAIDPCCGAGQFLVSLAEHKNLDRNNLYGIEIDPTAAYCAKLNLIIFFKDPTFSPNIITTDALACATPGELSSPFSHLAGQFDLVLTNPPWAGYKEKLKYSDSFPEISSGELFSYFLVKGCQLARAGGTICFILPESVLNISQHADIRRYLLQNVSVSYIEDLGRPFKAVFTRAIRLDFINTPPSSEWTFKTSKENSAGSYFQRDFSSGSENKLNIFSRSKDTQLIEKLINLDAVSLKNQAQWALGIVTGDNRHHLLSKPEQGAEPIYRGKDVNPFFLGQAEKYIRFAPSNFQQVAPIEKYRAPEKLIYRFISSRLIFAIDRKQRLTLNSANICIPTISNFPFELLCAYFNSSVAQFIFKVQAATHKVLRKDLEQIPIPTMLLEHTNDLLKSANSPSPSSARLDKIILGILPLSESEKANILQKFKE